VTTVGELRYIVSASTKDADKALDQFESKAAAKAGKAGTGFNKSFNTALKDLHTGQAAKSVDTLSQNTATAGKTAGTGWGKTFNDAIQNIHKGPAAKAVDTFTQNAGSGGRIAGSNWGNAFQKNVTQNVTKAAGSFSLMQAGVTGLTTALAGAALNAVMNVSSAIKAMGAGIISAGAASEDFAVTMKVLLQGADKADEIGGKLKTLAASTPFELTDLQRSAVMLSTNEQNVDKLVGKTKMLGDVAAGVGAPLSQLAYVYNQIQGNQKAYTQDLNQIGNTGFNVWGLLAEQLGTTNAGVRQMASEGKITADVVNTMFVNATSKGGQFYGMMEEKAGTTSGRISNLSDAFANLGVKLFEVVKPGVDSVVLSISNATAAAGLFVEKLAQNKDISMAWERATTAIGVMWGEVAQQLTGIKPELDLTKLATDAIVFALNKAMEAANGVTTYLKQNPQVLEAAVLVAKALGVALQIAAVVALTVVKNTEPGIGVFTTMISRVSSFIVMLNDAKNFLLGMWKAADASVSKHFANYVQPGHEDFKKQVAFLSGRMLQMWRSSDIAVEKHFAFLNEARSYFIKSMISGGQKIDKMLTGIGHGFVNMAQTGAKTLQETFQGTVTAVRGMFTQFFDWVKNKFKEMQDWIPDLPFGAGGPSEPGVGFGGPIRVWNSGRFINNSNQLGAHHTYQKTSRGTARDVTLFRGGSSNNVPVPSGMSGTARVGNDPRGYGNFVEVINNGVRMIFGHLEKALVRTGQKVQLGQKIGIQGNTGRSTGTHVHVEGPEHLVDQWVDGMIRGKLGISGGGSGGSVGSAGGNNMRKFAQLVSQAESGGRSNAVSSAGARGFFQFMPESRKSAIRGSGADPWSSNYETALKAFTYWVKQHGAADEVNAGQWGKVFKILRHQWTSLPGAAEATTNSRRIYQQLTNSTGEGGPEQSDLATPSKTLSELDKVKGTASAADIEKRTRNEGLKTAAQISSIMTAAESLADQKNKERKKAAIADAATVDAAYGESSKTYEEHVAKIQEVIDAYDDLVKTTTESLDSLNQSYGPKTEYDEANDQLQSLRTSYHDLTTGIDTAIQREKELQATLTRKSEINDSEGRVDALVGQRNSIYAGRDNAQGNLISGITAEQVNNVKTLAEGYQQLMRTYIDTDPISRQRQEMEDLTLTFDKHLVGIREQWFALQSLLQLYNQYGASQQQIAALQGQITALNVQETNTLKAKAEAQAALNQKQAEANDTVGQLGKAVAENAVGALQNALEGLLAGTMSLKDAFKGLIGSITQFLAKMAITQLLKGFGLGGLMGGGGGGILGFATGGFVPGTGNKDTVPAVLTPGELVVRKQDVKPLFDTLGANTYEQFRSRVKGFNQGGIVGPERSYASTTPVASSANIQINVPVNIDGGSNVDPTSAKRFGDAVRAGVIATIQKEKQAGGSLYKG